MPTKVAPTSAEVFGNALLAEFDLPQSEADEPEVVLEDETPEVAFTEEAEPQESPDDRALEAEDTIVSPPEVANDAVSDWVVRVRENPKAITGVPGSLRAAVVETLLAEARSSEDAHKAEIARIEDVRLKAVRDALEMGAAQAREQMRIDGFMQVAQQLETNDPQAFVRWLNEAPQNGPAYWQWKARTSMPSPNNSDGTETIRAAAAALLTELSEWPDLRDEAAREAAEKNIQADPEGMRQFNRIVSTKLAAALQRGTTSQRETAEAKPPAIKAAIDSAKGLPRPAGVADAGTAQTPNPAASNDPMALLEQGLRPAIADARLGGPTSSQRKR